MQVGRRRCEFAGWPGPEVSPGHHGLRRTPLKRAGTPTPKADPSIFARAKEPDGIRIGDELNLEDLVMDVRPDVHAAPLPLKRLPPKPPRRTILANLRDDRVRCRCWARSGFWGWGSRHTCSSPATLRSRQRARSIGKLIPRQSLTAPRQETVQRVMRSERDGDLHDHERNPGDVAQRRRRRNR